YRNDEQRAALLEYLEPIRKELRDSGITVKLDDRENYKPGWKFAEHEVQGVPVRIAAGPRDLENGTLELARRDSLEKSIIGNENLTRQVRDLLDEIQNNLLDKARQRVERQTRSVDTYEEFKEQIEEGGFILAHWDGTAETEEKIKEETKATIRCIPFEEY